MISAESVVEVKGSHYFIGNGDIFVNDGNTIKSLLHNRIQKLFISDYDADHYESSFTLVSKSNSEIWFCVPSHGSPTPTKAYIYNWNDDTWSIRDLPGVPYASYGPVSKLHLVWGHINETWKGYDQLWAQSQSTPMDGAIAGILPAPIGGKAKLILLETSLGLNESPFYTNIERVGYALEGLVETTTITNIYPHIDGKTDMYIQVGSQDRPGAPIRWKPAIKFNPEFDRKVDIRTTGELHCFRFFANSVVSSFNLSGMDIIYARAGKR